MKQHRQMRQQGFTIMEVCLALIVFTMMTLMFAAVFPVAIRAAKYSANYSQAALLAQHKLDQVRGAGYDKMDYASLRGLTVIDALVTAPASITPQAYSFTGVDNLLGGNGTTGILPANSMAAIIVSDYGSSATVTLPDGTTYTPQSNTSVSAGNVREATIVIRWQGAGLAPATYVSSALIVKH